MGKDHGANIAALHDHSAPSAQLLLKADHPRTNGGPNAHARCGVGHGLIADQAGHILAIEENAIVPICGFEKDGGLGGEGLESLAFVQRNSCAQGLQGEGAIHGAALDVEQAKMPGHATGNRTLARAGRAVNGYDDLAGGTNAARKVFFRTHARFFVSCLGLD